MSLAARRTDNPQLTAPLRHGAVKESVNQQNVSVACVGFSKAWKKCFVDATRKHFLARWNGRWILEKSEVSEVLGERIVWREGETFILVGNVVWNESESDGRSAFFISFWLYMRRGVTHAKLCIRIDIVSYWV